MENGFEGGNTGKGASWATVEIIQVRRKMAPEMGNAEEFQSNVPLTELCVHAPRGRHWSSQAQQDGS